MNRLRILDVLRAISILAIVLYHFEPTIFSGGFVGVDVFFVISGFLSTKSLLSLNHSKQVWHNFQIYIFRRIRRVLPTLFKTIIIICALLVFFFVDLRTKILPDIIASLGFVMNFYMLNHNISYNESLIPNLFSHVWYLSIQMQFWIVWSLFILLFCKILSKKSQKFKIRALKTVIVILVIFSVFISIYLYQTSNPNLAYLNSFAHLYPLLIGSFLAVVNFSKFTRTKLIFSVLNLTAPIVIFVTFIFFMFTVKFEDLSRQNYSLFIISAITALVIFFSNIHQLQTEQQNSWQNSNQNIFDKLSEKVLDNRLVKYISDKSISYYLFHFPLFIMFKSLLNSWILSGMVSIALMVFISHFSLRSILKVIVEKGKDLPIYISLAVTVLVVILCAVSIKTAPNSTTVQRLYEANARTGTAQTFKNLNDSISVKHLYPVLNDKDDITSKIIGQRTVVLGDSVTLSSYNYISDILPGVSIDAEINRKMCDGLDIMHDLSQKNALPTNVVIALATNVWNSTRKCTDQIIEDLPKGHHLVFVTGYGKNLMIETAQYLRTLPDEYPFITVADWASSAASNHVKMSTDGFHPGNREAQKVYADSILDAVQAVDWKPEK